MDKFESQIVDYVAGLEYKDLTRKAIEAAKERLLDSLAVAYASYPTEPVTAMRNFAIASSSPHGATVLGTSHKAPVDHAAVYLGTMIRALDWNDTYLNREPAHPSDNISATLTVAESENKSGQDFILSTILAYELHCRLCDAAGIRKKGWDHVTYGSISSAGAAAKLMGFTKNQIRDALAIAMTTGNFLRQTRVGTISKWKAAAFAQAAQNAIQACLYVKYGFTGPSDIFEGQHGFINQIIQGEFDLAPSFGGQENSEFKMVDTYIKYFPAEYHAQSAVWAALDLRKQLGEENLQKISTIHVETSFHSYEIIGKEADKWAPKTKETADHSLPYIVAVALMDGEISLEQFDKSHLENPKLLELVNKVTVSEKKEYTEIYGKSFPNKVRVRLVDATEYVSEVKDPRGHPNRPLSREELENKFRSSTAPFLNQDQQDKMIAAIWHLDELRNIEELMQMGVVYEYV
ncbi:MAG: propanediol utilization protein [Nitrospinaceae bacterium]|nr:MAG: propanediol utilization protein [Nitrospinaceae bacterium]